jgi:hypothetical protein
MGWESPKLTARANYASQSVLYLPVAGYFAGDRKGPFGEVTYRPVQRLELSGSASSYSNNVERNSNVPTFRSTAFSSGASIQLPWKFTAATQLSSLRFETTPEESAIRQRSDNRMWSATVTRPIRKHSLRLTWRDVRIRSNLRPECQRSAEVEDVLQWKRITLGAAVRLDSTINEQRRNSVFARGNAQLRLKRLTAFAQLESGRDLLNESVFATTAVTSSVIGASASLFGGWNLQAEAFRNKLTTSLNPGNIFLLETRGVGFPTLLGGVNQWSVFFRLTKTLRWGGPLPAQGLDRYTAERIPITGIIEGFVYEKRKGEGTPAAGVPVSLDGQRTADTDITGHYRFSDVPEGAHEVSFPSNELPADYEPGAAASAQVPVKSRRISRVDMEVIRLGEICGKVNGPAGASLEAVLVRLAPTTRYTTPEADGTFCFYNLREGGYEVQIDPRSLPSEIQLTTPERVPLTLDWDAAPPILEFRLERRVPRKPVRLVIGLQRAPAENRSQ